MGNCDTLMNDITGYNQDNETDNESDDESDEERDE